MRVVEKKPRGEGIEELGEAEGARRATGGSPSGAPPAGVVTGEEKPDVEVVATARRRRFTAEYKRRIVREADRCTKPGEIARLSKRAERAEALVELQKKLAVLLGTPLESEK